MLHFALGFKFLVLFCFVVSVKDMGEHFEQKITNACQIGYRSVLVQTQKESEGEREGIKEKTQSICYCRDCFQTPSNGLSLTFSVMFIFS